MIDSVSPVFTVLVADYQKYFKVSVDTASADVKKALQHWLKAVLSFIQRIVSLTRLSVLAGRSWSKGTRKWQIEFNYKVMPYLMGLSSQFTTYSLYDCGKINSVRVIRLYESLCQYRSSGVWVTTQNGCQNALCFLHHRDQTSLKWSERSSIRHSKR